MEVILDGLKMVHGCVGHNLRISILHLDVWFVGLPAAALDTNGEEQPAVIKKTAAYIHNDYYKDQSCNNHPNQCLSR